MRRVLHVLTVPESLLFLRGQANYMRSRGYALSVITSPGRSLEAFAVTEGVDVHPVEMARRIAPSLDVRSLARLTALVRRIRPDIVHAHTPKAGLLGMLAATAAGIQSRIYHLRGLPLATATGAKRLLLHTAERTSCSLASHLLAVSASLRCAVLQERLCPPSKIAVLGMGSGNGVDCERRFNPTMIDPSRRANFRASRGIPENAPVVGFVGRLVRDKGILELAAAWNEIRRAIPVAHLVVAGVFEERDAVPPQVREVLEHDSRVHLIGFFEDIATLYASMDVLALPTYREGFPNAALEAAAMGRPVVAARVTGCVDAIRDGETGMLVPARDARSLASALCRYLDDPSLRERHGQQARTRVQREYRPERIWQALADFYDSVHRPNSTPRTSIVSGELVHGE